jgi:hypothetical protein
MARWDVVDVGFPTCFEITSPAVENVRFDGTEVAGIIKYLMANA